MGHRHKLSKVLVLVGFVVLAVGTFMSYSISKMIMCGDRIMQNYPPGYLGLTMSNKNWLLLMALLVIGGSVGYIIYTFIRRRGRSAKSGGS